MNALTRRPHSGGFTLIELLIVVAIIAILAAIAVPNFLEAQTRAKISRVRNDLRAIATAIEPYMADNNKYPPSCRYAGEAMLAGSGAYPATGYATMAGVIFATTPVAYITVWPKMPFPVGQTWSSNSTMDEMLGKMGVPYFYLTTKVDPAHGPTNGYGPERAKGYQWLAYSQGPAPPALAQVKVSGDGRGYFYYPPRKAFPSKMRPYDATNGTKSIGGFCRYGPGGEDYSFDPEI